MRRLIPTPAGLGMLVLLLALTVLRWARVWDGTISLCLGVALGLTGKGETVLPGMYEQWIAVVVWWFFLIFLLFVVVRHTSRVQQRNNVSSSPGLIPRRLSSLVLATMLFVSLTSSLLVPVPPNVQGNLLNSRLLPPLARGMLIIDIGEDREGDGTSLEGRFRFLQRKLLDSRVVLSGPDEKGNEPRPGVSEGSRNDFHFLFGSDDAGRDVLSRAIAGARVSLGIGLAAALASLLIGAFIGLAAGLGGRWMDVLLMRLTDLALAIPGIFVAIGLVAFFGQSILTLVLVLAGLGWMGTARIVRGQVLVLREREFVLAAGLLGVPAWRIAVRHLVPNLLPVLVSATVLQFANAVLAEAALGFLGLGVQPPTASWGNMMGEALGSLQRGWWIGLFPGAMLASVLVAAHSMAEDSPGP